MKQALTIAKTSLMLDGKLHRGIKVIAAQEGKTISELLNEGLTLVIAKYGKGK